MKLPGYHENPEILHVGTEDCRSYYIPYSSDEKAFVGERESSERFIPLSGVWEFAYFESPLLIPAMIMSPDFDHSFFGRIPVPSVWQMHGYDKHQYTNIKYPFPYDPPYVPDMNPCGLYVRKFDIDRSKGIRHYINFEGVDSCFYLYINGEFAGYSQVSHSTSEFDISSLLHDGENTIAVLVLKWCDGSYLEDQDKFRQSGIFRDVYILTRPDEHIRDYFVKTKIAENSADITVNFSFRDKPVDISVTLYDADDTEIASSTVENGSVTLTVNHPILWNAENPYLYNLLIRSGGEVITQCVGIRKITVENGVILLNGSTVRFKGVNRHDSDPFVGAAITPALAARDMALMKAHNINAIRTSHYPNSPWFPQLCDRLGFYLIAEADIEAHGVTTIYGGSMSKTYGLLAQDPMYRSAMIDRVQRCVTRDKNCPSILFWSLGNEAGFGKNLEDAGRWVKDYDTSRLLHYEGSVHESGGHTNDTSMLDVYNRMYDHVDSVTAYFENDDENRKPYILCEYIHAMGNGPGDAEDYFELMEKYDGFAGGFVWEWCDHAIYMGTTTDGRDKFFYGGDFGEFPHDGNFCMDGLVYPDRIPHTGLAEYKNVIRPARAKLENNGVSIKNMLDFTDLFDYLTVDYEITLNGVTISSGSFDVQAAPHETVFVPLSLPAPESGNCYLNLVYRQKPELFFTASGHVLGYEQLTIHEASLSLPPLFANDKAFYIKEDDTEFTVEGSCFRYVFDRINGTFSEMCYSNNTLLTQPMEYNIWRAPTDNDMHIRGKWRQAGYDRAVIKVYSSEITLSGGITEISCHLGILAVHIQKIINIKAIWQIGADGCVNISLECEKNMDMPYLPRFGLRLFMPESFDRVEYFGFGENESYIDKHRSCIRGLFSAQVDELHEDYLKPQENGSHYGCDYVSIAKSGGLFIKAVSDKRICFNASHYTQEELNSKTHSFELEKCGSTVLCLDYAQSGMGSNSCGPELLPQYRLNEERFTYNLSLIFGITKI